MFLNCQVHCVFQLDKQLSTYLFLLSMMMCLIPNNKSPSLHRLPNTNLPMPYLPSKITIYQTFNSHSLPMPFPNRLVHWLSTLILDAPPIPIIPLPFASPMIPRARFITATAKYRCRLVNQRSILILDPSTIL